MAVHNLSEKAIEFVQGLSQSKSFLGREFLTWLWYRVEKDAGAVQISHGERLETVEVWFDNRLLLVSPQTKGLESLIKGGDPIKSDEARVALATGKLLQEARLGMRVEGVEGDYRCVLRGEDLMPRSLVLPDDPEYDEVESARHPLEQRLEKVNRFLQALDGLFRRFMTDRVDADWEQKGAKEMRAWIMEKFPDDLISAPLH